PEAELVRYTRAEVGDQHIRRHDQRAHDLPATVGPQVQNDAAFVAVERVEVAVALVVVRRLHLDHISALVGEDLGAERPGDEVFHAEDSDAVERPWTDHRWLLLTSDYVRCTAAVSGTRRTTGRRSAAPMPARSARRPRRAPPRPGRRPHPHR